MKRYQKMTTTGLKAELAHINKNIELAYSNPSVPLAENKALDHLFSRQLSIEDELNYRKLDAEEAKKQRVDCVIADAFQRLEARV